MFEDYDGDINMPVITLEVLSNTTDSQQTNALQMEVEHTEEIQDAGVHFLTDTQKDELINDVHEKEESSKDSTKVMNEFLEYMTRNDGSVVCKLCGEILQSRTHWYRHKYKLHVIQPLNPAPLFQCEQCLVYFKSRKGYIGHLASRHSDVLSDSSPVLSNSQIDSNPKETLVETNVQVKEEPDPELAIPKSSVLNYQNNLKQNTVKSEQKKEKHFKITKADTNNKSEWEERRSREEKLVADIIDRVRKECEAQGSGGAARRGYTRRTTVMHT